MYNFETWLTAKGEWIDIIGMTENHINNTINLLNKKPDIIKLWCEKSNIDIKFAVNNQIVKNYAKIWIEVFRIELERRKTEDINSLVMAWGNASEKKSEIIYTTIKDTLKKSGFKYKETQFTVGWINYIFISWVDKNGEIQQAHGWRSSIEC